MATLTMREALNQAMREEMKRDPNVFLLGEEVGHYQGPYKVTQGLLQEFGEWRVRDTPIAEESPFPGPETLHEDVYVRSPYMNMAAAEKDPAWQASIKEDRVPEKFPAWAAAKVGS